jgi:hypothetical protein
MGALAIIGLACVVLLASIGLRYFTTRYQPREILRLEHTGPAAPAIQAMLARVDAREIGQTVQELQRLPTRAYKTAGNRRAADYILTRLSRYPNLDVHYQGGDLLTNVIATLRGSESRSRAALLVGAHYDTAASAEGPSPGATDNGCGVAIVMELARVMSQLRYRRTLEFAFWNAEEAGLLGSTAFAKAAKEQSREIVLYLNYDSACYVQGGGPVLDVMYNIMSRAFARDMAEANATYGIGLRLTYNLHPCQSDHRSFWAVGYPAIMTHVETHGPAHSPADTIDKVPLWFAAKNAQLGMSLLAEMARIDTSASVVPP